MMETTDDTDKGLSLLMSRPEGLNFLRWLLFSICAADQTPYAPNDRDTAFLAGQHTIGTLILQRALELDPMLLKKLKEIPDA